jgi:hypothetical protein
MGKDDRKQNTLAPLGQNKKEDIGFWKLEGFSAKLRWHWLFFIQVETQLR